jgi:molybdenum cofactor sulfurtransferase
MADHTPCGGYNINVEAIRPAEYPMLKDTIYLDHAGSTPPAASLVTQFAADLAANLYANPHSASVSSQLTSSRVADIRLRLLTLFSADPAEFDLVFTANTTAAVKLVVEALRASSDGFRYVYHQACHTSLVGVREEAADSVCIDDAAVEDWIEGISPLSGRERRAPSASPTTLFAYTAQSHMDGRRYPFSWGSSVRDSSTMQHGGTIYTLVDAASLAATSPLDLGDRPTAPDFTVLSLHKMFGFPDLGALIVRRDAAPLFNARRYFGGGTVEVAVCGPHERWHITKQGALHERLEDGTIPFHSIIALDTALNVHTRLFGSMTKVAAHASSLADRLHSHLERLRHANGAPVCVMYSPPRRRCPKSGRASSGPSVPINIITQLGRA